MITLTCYRALSTNLEVTAPVHPDGVALLPRPFPVLLPSTVAPRTNEIDVTVAKLRNLMILSTVILSYQVPYLNIFRISVKDVISQT